MQTVKFELPIGAGKARQIVTVERYPKGHLHTLRIKVRGASLYFNDEDERVFRREVFTPQRTRSRRPSNRR
jgi:hypothetical protein